MINSPRMDLHTYRYICEYMIVLTGLGSQGYMCTATVYVGWLISRTYGSTSWLSTANSYQMIDQDSLPQWEHTK